MVAGTRHLAQRASVGGLPLRRALPVRGRHLIGAWCFLDHGGPADIAEGPGMRVGPHPHTGLQTFTWLIEGEILHRDSIGSEQLIRPGQVNLMTAGRGIAHSEESLPGHPRRLHFVQLWIALPDATRHCAPAFAHHPQLPVVVRDSWRQTVLVGEWLEERSPVAVHTPLLAVDLASGHAAQAQFPLRADFEYGVLVLEGEAQVDGEALACGTLLYLPPGQREIGLRCAEPARVLLLGGEPWPERPLVWWNFVARTRDEVVDYTRRWNAGEHFGEVRGFDGPRIPAPAVPEGLKQP